MRKTDPRDEPVFLWTATQEKEILLSALKGKERKQAGTQERRREKDSGRERKKGETGRAPGRNKI